MSERVIAPSTYLIVLGVLIVLTIVTTAVSFFDVSGLGHIVAGLAIGLVKASLVVLFFMHAIHSSQTTWAVIAVTAFWFVAVLLCLTFSDYFTRGELPHLPGH